ncbi:POL5 protein, partial [Brachypodius atriceps]|nr:POL5 protein [Brachypodius atriceps]
QTLSKAPSQNQGPLQPGDTDHFAFTWERQNKYSPTLGPELEKILKPDDVNVYQYIDDILVGEEEKKVVGDTQEKIISHLENLNLQIPSEKIQTPSHEVKFLGIWWKGGMTNNPPDSLTSLDQIKMLESMKDLQHALGFLVFWRKYIPDFLIIARPLYDLLRKGVKWELTTSQEETMQLLIFETTAHQTLGPIYPIDP